MPRDSRQDNGLQRRAALDQVPRRDKNWTNIFWPHRSVQMTAGHFSVQLWSLNSTPFLHVKHKRYKDKNSAVYPDNNTFKMKIYLAEVAIKPTMCFQWWQNTRQHINTCQINLIKHTWLFFVCNVHKNPPTRERWSHLRAGMCSRVEFWENACFSFCEQVSFQSALKWCESSKNCDEEAEHADAVIHVLTKKQRNKAPITLLGLYLTINVVQIILIYSQSFRHSY